MSAGMVIEVSTQEIGREPARVEVLSEADPEARYDRLLDLVLRMGSWLTGPRARLLPPEAWERLFAEYQCELQELRRLGDELRPVSLRARPEALCDRELLAEVSELFAA